MDAPHPLLIASARDDGSHSGCSYSRAVKQGRLLRLRRGIYIAAPAWIRSQPSDRYRLVLAATALQRSLHHHRDSVFCRESALHIFGLPLISLPQKVHLRAGSPGAVRTLPQTPLTGGLPPADFWTRAQSAADLGDAVLSPALLRGFPTHRHQPIAAPLLGESSAQSLALPQPDLDPDRWGQLAVTVEPLETALVETVSRMPFGDSIVVLDSALRGGELRAPVQADKLRDVAENALGSQRLRRHFNNLLAFASPLAESPGESLARARFRELGFADPQLQTTMRVDGATYRLDFLWEEANVVGEFDGWQKYRIGFDQAMRQEKVREDAIRGTGRKVVRFYWEDLMEPGCRRLKALLTRAGVPRLGSRPRRLHTP